MFMLHRGDSFLIRFIFGTCGAKAKLNREIPASQTTGMLCYTV